MTQYARHVKLQGYAHLYIVVKDGGNAVKCCPDGLMMAWTDWDKARREAALYSGFVTNWETFNELILPKVIRRPPAMRIFNHTKRGLRTFHAELDAGSDELRTLNEYTPTDLEKHPDEIKDRLSTAKVWEEPNG